MLWLYLHMVVPRVMGQTAATHPLGHPDRNGTKKTHMRFSCREPAARARRLWDCVGSTPSCCGFLSPYTRLLLMFLAGTALSLSMTPPYRSPSAPPPPTPIAVTSIQEEALRVIDAAEDGLRKTYEASVSVVDGRVRLNSLTFIGSLGRGSFAEVALAVDDTGSRYVRSMWLPDCTCGVHSLGGGGGGG
jgi:hypothetical protein